VHYRNQINQFKRKCGRNFWNGLVATPTKKYQNLEADNNSSVPIFEVSIH
jgi:hypothetical protein